MPTTICPSVLWNTNYAVPNSIGCDFLLPNGLVITLEFARETSLEEVRERVWSEAKKLRPVAANLLNKLKPPENYLLVSVTHDAKPVEYFDYSKRLCDLKLFYTFFKVVEIQGNLQEKTYYSCLNKAIGLHINEIDQIDESELIEFRLSLFRQLKQNMDESRRRCAEAVAAERTKNRRDQDDDEEDNAANDDDEEEREFRSFMECMYAPNLEIDPSLLDTSLVNTVDRLKKIKFSDENSPATTTTTTTTTTSISSGKLEINVHVMETDQPEVTYHLSIDPDSITPTQIIIDIIKAKLSALKQSDDQIAEIIDRYKDAYMLNVCGCDEILYGDKHKMSAYKYIRECMSSSPKKPNFHLISIDKIKARVQAYPSETSFFTSLTQKTIRMLEDHARQLDEEETARKQQQQQQQQQVENSRRVELSWSSTSSNELFSLYLDNLVYLPKLKECERVFLKLAIYHGQELRQQLESQKLCLAEKLSNGGSTLRINQTVTFDVRVRNLNRCARLCISVHCISKKKKEFFSIGWISVNLFDHKGYLASGKKKLFLWQATQNSFLNQCLSDVTGQNPDMDYIRLNVEFMRPKLSEGLAAGGSSSSSLSSKMQQPLLPLFVYPTRDQIMSFVKRFSSNNNSQDECIDVSYALENDNALLESILAKDALAELTEQEKNVLWRRREDCLNYPHSLPKLLQSVKWSHQADVVDIYNLLFRWPDVKPMVAIELLHAPASSCADLEVRSFAVKCLDKHMRDEEVQLCLLQLVQSLKSEPYYDNALTRFLLKRALGSHRIGSRLFWMLKSEMKNPRYKYRFGLILEAYCRGIRTYQLRELLKQIEVVEKLTSLAQQIKSYTGVNNNGAVTTIGGGAANTTTSASTLVNSCGSNELATLVKSTYLRDVLRKPDYVETLSNFTDPGNRSHVFGSLDPLACRILTSAKRPLLLTWLNALDYANHYRDTFELIFKHGDDLRQDMLTLQILKLMDLCWKSEGLDLNMLIYDCFSTGTKTGFIEVIKNSMTLFKIQMEGGMRGRYQIDTSQLYRWILANNPNRVDEAVESFTRSCAGFCVATFILGIGDRHPDNIMVNRDGQLFHIDFGHFLGHFKKKYGIKRERVPFVLTEDFTKVISRGSANPIETNEFKRFKRLCETAYRIIRRYSHLIVNLFALMLASDMPELQSIEDIMYLRKTLAIDEPNETAALEYFRTQFNEAYKLSYTTKLDWMCHALNKKNLL